MSGQRVIAESGGPALPWTRIVTDDAGRWERQVVYLNEFGQKCWRVDPIEGEAVAQMIPGEGIEPWVPLKRGNLWQRIWRGF